MTIAVTLKVNDGLVLAADSASTFASAGGVVNVYNNANKVFNLRKGLPIGLITWGLGSLAGLSISTLAKDLRERLTGDPSYPDWELDPATYTIAGVAQRVREYFYDEHYTADAAAVAEAVAALEEAEDPDGEGSLHKPEPFPSLGFFVVGYSAGSRRAEEYHLDLSPQECLGPLPVRPPEETGVSWAGQQESLTRLINGRGGLLGAVLEVDFGVPAADVPDAVALIESRLGSNIVNPGMPFQDAIDLAEWLVGIAIGYSRFMPGAATVGGPIETAAITKHEGFKWVRRKHYFDARLNPPEVP
jgi:hypothetical protein